MRVLPDVVGDGPRVRGRWVLAVGTAVAAVIALTGCSQFNAALGQRQAVVTFHADTSVAQRLAVRAACAKPPSVTAEPLPSNANSSYAIEEVIYQINKASDADVALLEECLSRFPSVVGVTLQDSSDQGN